MRLAPNVFSVAALLLGAPAAAQLVEHKDLSLAAALVIATGALDACKAQGYQVSVAVIGREGQVLVRLRGDGSPPHSTENSFRRAYTALTYRLPSGEIEQRVRKDPDNQLVHLDHVMAAQGGLPIKIGSDTLGAVAVSGSPGGDRDEACARSGIDKAVDLLK